MAVMSLLVELGAPLALLDRRLGRLWALGGFAMHWGILAIMGIRFRYQLRDRLHVLVRGRATPEQVDRTSISIIGGRA